ncbi:MAG TPA: hypothetical protein V6D27_13795 [Vampirovibrionales bacterium]
MFVGILIYSIYQAIQIQFSTQSPPYQGGFIGIVPSSGDRQLEQELPLEKANSKSEVLPQKIRSNPAKLNQSGVGIY